MKDKKNKKMFGQYTNILYQYTRNIYTNIGRIKSILHYPQKNTNYEADLVNYFGSFTFILH